VPPLLIGCCQSWEEPEISFSVLYLIVIPLVSSEKEVEDSPHLLRGHGRQKNTKGWVECGNETST
jgi:hypothetical protein